MIDYSQGKVYKIIANEGYPKCYIGSTTKKYVSQRMVQHIHNYNSWKNGKKSKQLSSFTLFEQFGPKNCSIVLIENVAAKSKDELRAREQAQIDKHDCVNKLRAFLTEKQHQNVHKEYRLKNRIAITAKRSIKVACTCGKYITKWHIAQHRKMCKVYTFEKHMDDTINKYRAEKPREIIKFELHI
jgi:hypothetical protein